MQPSAMPTAQVRLIDAKSSAIVSALISPNPLHPINVVSKFSLSLLDLKCKFKGSCGWRVRILCHKLDYERIVCFVSLLIKKIPILCDLTPNFRRKPLRGLSHRFFDRDAAGNEFEFKNCPRLFAWRFGYFGCPVIVRVWAFRRPAFRRSMGRRSEWIEGWAMRPAQHKMRCRP